MDNTEGTFQYTYSAKERSEVEDIRRKYLPAQEDKMERLRKLDRSASQKAQAWAIGLGTVGALVMGTGMSLVMTELGSRVPFSMPVGIGVGLLGMVLVALAYPLYNSILKRERQRIAPEILRLTDELMK